MPTIVYMHANLHFTLAYYVYQILTNARFRINALATVQICPATTYANVHEEHMATRTFQMAA